jgi:hypothetical protein
MTVAMGLSAQSREDFEAILVPVYTSGPGAYGSEWTSVLRIYNSGNTAADFGRPVYIAPCQVAAPCPAPVPANTAVSYAYGPNFANGSILWEPKTHASLIAYQLRIRDTSRALETWGTEIPVVRESEFTTSAIHILDVPMTAEFRQTLRVYSLAAVSSPVRLRIYTQSEPTLDNETPLPTLLVEQDLILQLPVDPDGEPIFKLFPTAMRIDNLAGWFPQTRGHEVVRIELLTKQSNVPIWGFVSITNNDTQHVTTLTPR